MDISKDGYIIRWNINKRENKIKNHLACKIIPTPMQTLPEAYILRLAVGSTKLQDFELLN
jgi:hypothetical protein